MCEQVIYLDLPINMDSQWLAMAGVMPFYGKTNFNTTTPESESMGVDNFIIRNTPTESELWQDMYLDNV